MFRTFLLETNLYDSLVLLHAFILWGQS
ncbi:BnaA06g02260D [Brassica napus]|uniref:BnaA06g02260D protein n=1 Tax=Brassica napus TaxID=3708 RepID=A0A078GBU2_BRANA|nr:BnaA06g02260D [Brassica napus]